MESRAFKFCETHNVPASKRQDAAKILHQISVTETTEQWIELTEELIGIIKVKGRKAKKHGIETT